MDVVRHAQGASAWCEARRAQGKRVGFVPTMGSLHAGHRALMAEAQRHSETLVVSIFVNPTQFAPGEDLASYPRDLRADLALCEEAGVGLVFAPPNSELYAPAHETWVEVTGLERGLCGDRRPGHFRGVATVVIKLLNIVGRCVAVFGEKDYQQLQVIRRMVADLFLPATIYAHPTVREADGLAMSSRNAYLSGEERRSAASLYRGLRAAKERVTTKGTVAPEGVLGAAREVIVKEPMVRLDYLEVRQRETLAPVTVVHPGRCVMLVAAQVGKARLIDNILL